MECCRTCLGGGHRTRRCHVCTDSAARLAGARTFLAKEPFILAGIELLQLVYRIRGGTDLEILKASGSCIQPKDVLANVSGSALILLECERVALNFLQRLSGVATLARRHVKAVAGTKAQVLDTRKTTPGLRLLEKYAAAAGGAVNHRQGLFDAVLIKNNHITASGGVRNALAKVKDFTGPVEIEVHTLAELDEALNCGAKHLLLDNLTPLQAREWIEIINGRATTELSGNINLENIRHYAEAGADFISCGAITHSARAVDISFKLDML